MQNRYLTQFYLPLFAMVAVGPTAAHAMIDPVYVGTGAKGAENNPQILGDDFAEWKTEHGKDVLTESQYKLVTRMAEGVRSW